MKWNLNKKCWVFRIAHHRRNVSGTIGARSSPHLTTCTHLPRGISQVVRLKVHEAVIIIRYRKEEDTVWELAQRYARLFLFRSVFSYPPP